LTGRVGFLARRERTRNHLQPSGDFPAPYWKARVRNLRGDGRRSRLGSKRSDDDVK
jgi:hypothetical protein